jgi:HlyD family secretion protein
MGEPVSNSTSTPAGRPARPAGSDRNNTKRRARRWVPYAAAFALLAAIVAGLWPQPAPVETAHATSGQLQTTVSEEGKTRIKQRFVVSAPVLGQLRRISLKAGAEVQVGYTVLAVIDPLSPALLDARSRTQAEAKRDAAKVNLDKAADAHGFAQKEMRRFEKLYAQQAVSVQELEPIQWRATSTARDQAAAESALRQAEAELSVFNPTSDAASLAERIPVEVRAPANGRVLRVLEESSRVVTAGTPLMEIGDPADLEAVVEVLSRDGAAIMPGTKVELEQWGGGPPLEAKVRLVEPAAFTKVSALGVEEQRVNVVADILTPPEQRRGLGDSFRVEARIITWETDQALKVPSGALFRRGEQWATFLLDHGRARLCSVKVGRSSGAETQVLEGLKQGDEVILYPGERIHDGQRVKPITI